MERYNKIKELFPTFIGDVEVDYNYSEDGDYYDTIEHINVPENRCYYRYRFMAECGCCTTSDTDYSDRLDVELNCMADSEFQCLINQLNRLKSK